MSSYKAVSNRANFNESEKEVIDFWKANNIFQKSIDNRKGSEEYIFFEGPPTANGKPGVHHVLARTFKDLVCRYQTMRGRYVERKAGWDEHGLPVEIEVQKQNDLKSKEDIENLGITEFNKRCAQSTQTYINEWQDLTERMAYWVDFDKAYRTSDPQYINNVWSILKHLHGKDLLYKGFKIVPWACDSGTTVSQAEVALGYKDVIDKSAYVKFQLTDSAQGALGLDNTVYMLAWTTTPWTLPSNMALAIGADIKYSIYQSSSDQSYIIASQKRSEKLLENTEEQQWSKVRDISGSEIVAQLGENNSYYSLFESDTVAALGIHLANFVEDGEEIGTGIVHIAPAFGQDDYDLYQSLEISDKPDILNLVHPNGDFTDEAPEVLNGQSIFNPHKKTGQLEFARINNIICKLLKEDNLLLKTEEYDHSYPHNWRTGNPLIYFLRPSWYVATSKLKEKMIAANQKINWYPDHIREGRFGNWLENNVDWSISRERYWGTPLPIWIGDRGSIKVIGSMEELAEISGQKISDPHKHIVDDISWTDSNGETFNRVAEVIDCWFDSGSMPSASYGTGPANFKVADYICEAIDQTRGWFYSLLAIASGCSDEPISPYKDVLCLGHILDKDGQKMSKSKGNIVNPWDLFEQFGADAVRWYFISNCSPGNPVRFDHDGVAEVVKRFFLQLWNTYSFFVLYANLDKVSPQQISEFQGFDSLTNLDKWYLAYLKDTQNKVISEYEKFEFSKVANLLENAVDRLSNVWVRANRSRFWNNSTDDVDMAAYYVLNTGLMTVVKLAAPLIPMLSETIYQNLKQDNEAESIHLTDWLESNSLSEEESSLVNELAEALEVINLGRNLRQQHQMKIRQPLQAIYLPEKYKSSEKFADFILSELNIKKITYKAIDEVELELNLNDDLLSEGYARELIHGIQALRKNNQYEVADRIKLYVNCPSDKISSLIESKKDHIMSETLSIEWVALPENSDQKTKNIKLGGEVIVVATEKA